MFLNNWEERIIGDCSFGVPKQTSTNTISDLAKLLTVPLVPKKNILGGRGGFSIGQVSGVGGVVVKHYHRGGLLSGLIGRKYLRFGTLRPQSEAELLLKVRSLGVRAPEPLAYAYKGNLIYQGWLFTREVESHQSLAELSLVNESKISDIVAELSRQVFILIEHGICHVDLHPGNVVIDSRGKVFLLDFDKTIYKPDNTKKLRDYYLCRWRRAVIKHKLPELLSEELSAQLRRTSPPE